MRAPRQPGVLPRRQVLLLLLLLLLLLVQLASGEAPVPTERNSSEASLLLRFVAAGIEDARERYPAGHLTSVLTMRLLLPAQPEAGKLTPLQLRESVYHARWYHLPPRFAVLEDTPSPLQGSAAVRQRRWFASDGEEARLLDCYTRRREGSSDNPQRYAIGTFGPASLWVQQGLWAHNPWLDPRYWLFFHAGSRQPETLDRLLRESAQLARVEELSGPAGATLYRAVVERPQRDRVTVVLDGTRGFGVLHQRLEAFREGGWAIREDRLTEPLAITDAMLCPRLVSRIIYESSDVAATPEQFDERCQQLGLPPSAVDLAHSTGLLPIGYWRWEARAICFDVPPPPEVLDVVWPPGTDVTDAATGQRGFVGWIPQTSSAQPTGEDK